MRSLDELTAREFLAFSNKYLQLFGLVGYNWHTLVASKIRRVYMLAVAAFLIIEGAINVQKLAIDRAPYRSNFAFLKTIALMLVFGAGTVNAVHTVLASFLHVDQKIEILVTVALVDRQLRTLNATTTYSKKVLKTRIRFVCAFLTFCFVWDFFSLLRYNRKMIISLVIMKYTPRLIVWADMFDFLLYIEVMRQQLRSSNDKLRRLVDESADKCNNYAQDGKITRDVCTLIGIHTMIRKACLTYNNLYGLRLVCIMLTILTKIVLYTYFMIVEDVTYLTLPARTKSPWTLPDLVTYNLYFTGVIVSFFMFIFRLLDQITKTKKQVSRANRTVNYIT